MCRILKARQKTSFNKCHIYVQVEVSKFQIFENKPVGGKSYSSAIFIPTWLKFCMRIIYTISRLTTLVEF